MKQNKKTRLINTQPGQYQTKRMPLLISIENNKASVKINYWLARHLSR